MSTSTDKSAAESKIDVLEHGMDREGKPATTTRRLFMQLHVFTGCTDSSEIVRAVEASGIEAVVYLDLNDPRGIGLLTMTEEPAFFVDTVRPLVNSGPFRALTHRPEMTMLGRSYASGYEPNVEDWLVGRPKRNTRNPNWLWAVWYPLRRLGGFNALPDSEQKSILREHGGIGRLYGQQDLAHDIRLACHGLDTNDNEFVIGLVGGNLHPLSHLVQTMRRTRQTSEFMEKMGPFFVGRALYQSAI
jgi:chlorite dismutase